MLNRDELKLALKTLMIGVYLLALYIAGNVLAETFTVFDYGRF